MHTLTTQRVPSILRIEHPDGKHMLATMGVTSTSGGYFHSTPGSVWSLSPSPATTNDSRNLLCRAIGNTGLPAPGRGDGMAAGDGREGTGEAGPPAGA